jgi:predicted dehydrogenase
MIGTSAIARSHLEALKSIGVLCVGISGRINLANLERLALEFDIPRTFTSWEKALSETEFDSLVVCTPPDVSFEILNHISGSGTACLVEKPLLRSEMQLNRLGELELEKTFVAFNRRHYDTVAELKRQITREPKGELIVEIHESDIEGVSSRIGTLINNSIHILDLILYLTGSRFADIQISDFSSTNLGVRVQMIANVTPVSLSIKFGIPANTSVIYDTPGTRYLLRPIEQLTKFNSFDIDEPTPTSSIRKYLPSWKGSEHQITNEPTLHLKPGFLNQATEFKNFLDKNLVGSAMTSMDDASQTLQLAFSLVRLL